MFFHFCQNTMKQEYFFPPKKTNNGPNFVFLKVKTRFFFPPDDFPAFKNFNDHREFFPFNKIYHLLTVVRVLYIILCTFCVYLILMTLWDGYHYYAHFIDKKYMWEIRKLAQGCRAGKNPGNLPSQRLTTLLSSMYF